MKIKFKSLTELVNSKHFVSLESISEEKRTLKISTSDMDFEIDADCCGKEVEIYISDGVYVSDDYDIDIESRGYGSTIDKRYDIETVAEIIEDDKALELCIGTITQAGDNFVLSSDGEDIFVDHSEVVKITNYFLECLGYHGIEG
jgi:hypothetical protein